MKYKLIVYDFDGVMTNNQVILSEDGKESVILNRSDGLAISLIKKLEINQCIVSSESNPVVSKRAEKLGIRTFQSVLNKLKTIKALLEEYELNPSEVAFIGNDLNDLEVIEYLPHSFCPKDSNKKILESSTFVLNKKGGKGVIMAFYEHIMENSLG